MKRFNESAAKGLDPDFGRGQSAYNDCLGDPGITQPLARASRPGAVLRHGMYPPSRHMWGVVTNQYAQVLDENDRRSPGSTPRATSPPR